MKLSRTTGLVNLLYDIRTGTRFTPYIGGGVGFSWRKFRRNFSEILLLRPEFTRCSTFAALYVTNTPPLSALNAPVRVQARRALDFAAAVQAGIAYNITDSITWDNGWQMLWESTQLLRRPVCLRREHDRL